MLIAAYFQDDPGGPLSRKKAIQIIDKKIERLRVCQYDGLKPDQWQLLQQEKEALYEAKELIKRISEVNAKDGKILEEVADKLEKEAGKLRKAAKVR